ncbi:hypothetical protein [Streptomyces sp. NPDC002520]
MICARCNEPICPGERYVTIDHISPSGPGATVRIHEDRCQPTLTHTRRLSQVGGAR